MTSDALNPQIPIGDVVPHSGRMLLLDRVVALGDDSLTAELTIRENGPFVRDGSVGAWVGVEYMSQAAAAFSGYAAAKRGEAPKIGFLLGARQFTTNVARFPVGARLLVTVVRTWEDASGMASLTATIHGDDIVVDAVLTVFQPGDVEDFMRNRQA